MTPDRFIFVGFELTDDIKNQIATCPDRDKVYLEDATYLETVVVDGTQYIGKRAEDGIAIDRLEDIARSVVSLLARVCTEWTAGPDKTLILAAETEDQGVIDTPSPEEADRYNYSDLIG
ncbi:MAG: hypothetical protein QNJ97_05515 [Myxococcota bacterium]|nr:hypothetical protein [Myxococcota bacterium]